MFAVNLYNTIHKLLQTKSDAEVRRWVLSQMPSHEWSPKRLAESIGVSRWTVTRILKQDSELFASYLAGRRKYLINRT